MTQEQEREYCYYEEQDDLESVKEWIEWTRSWRDREAEWLEQNLGKVVTDITSFEKRLEKIRSYDTEDMFEIGNRVLDRDKVEVERYRQMLENKRVNILRHLRDLVRWEREDLEWTWKLERHERETSEERPRNKKQQRAADWKTRKQANS